MPFKDAGRWLLTPAPVAPLLWCPFKKNWLTQSKATSANLPMQHLLSPLTGSLWRMSVQRIGHVMSLVVFQAM